jgi:tetratricopeptide (TPR) repeat protein
MLNGRCSNGFGVRRSVRNILYCLLFAAYCLLSFPASAKFDYNTNCQQAMQAILNLQFRDAQAMIREEKRINPDNGYIIYLEHYSDAVQLIISEDKRIYEKMINGYESQMDEMDRLDDGTPDNEWLQAEMLFHLGIAQIRYGTRINGVSKMVSSYRRIKEHHRKNPAFWQNQKLLGVYNIMLDFVPPFMRWATEMFGFSGSAELGMYQLKQYDEHALGVTGLAEEAVLITTLAYKLTRDEAGGLNYLASQQKLMADCSLIKYLYGVAALNAYQNNMALALLPQIYMNGLQISFYGLDYMTGRAKLNHIEPDANVYFERFLNTYPGEDYRKDVCNRLSYFYLLRGNLEKYKEYNEMVSIVGADLRDNDQEALLESTTGIIPDINLLKARLLCDGGYFPEAMTVLQAIDVLQLKEDAYKVEYHYRLGRILQLSGKPDESIPELTAAFNEGKELPYTYATRAALNLGRIYETSKNYPAAVEWYRKCIEVYSSDHTADGVRDDAERGEKRARAQF